MSSYYNIFKDTEFTIQNTDSNQTYKIFKPSYQNGGNTTDVIYEDMNDISKTTFSKKETTTSTNSKFRKSCNQSRIQNFKQPIIQIAGFYIQL
jgi:hypothetical protein